MKSFSAEAVLRTLKPFQRDTVEHAFEQLFGTRAATGSGRFLVSDETGLGKSIVARGLIAKAIDHLSSTVPRIDIVYICSNQDLAKQNLARLNVTGDKHISMTTRLSLLAMENHRLADMPADGSPKVNLVSFTPGTSFQESGWRQGSAEERALLAFFLDLITNHDDEEKQWATRVLLQGNVTTTERFTARVDRLSAKIHDNYDQRISEEFEKDINESGILARFECLRDDPELHDDWSGPFWDKIQNTIADLRSALSKAGVEALEPDLIILDEFQRFKHLLDRDGSDAAELAHSLFEFRDAQVLMLSATPYKPYTGYDDVEETHVEDFLATLRFLKTHKPSSETSRGSVCSSADEEAKDVSLPIQNALRRYREATVRGDQSAAHADDVRRLLLPIMTRAERPLLAESTDLVRVRSLESKIPTAKDIAEWASLSELGRITDSSIHVEMWKSIPHFSSFMGEYKIGKNTSAALHIGSKRAAVAAALEQTNPLRPIDVESFAPIDMGNGHLRALREQTLDRGWWQLLWMPPTMPYLRPGKIFAPLSDGSVTKQVIFSSWTGVPISVASLLSYESDRMAAGDRSVLKAYSAEGRKQVASRLQYRVTAEQVGAMSTLALFWPHPGAANLADELASARREGDRISAEKFVREFITTQSQTVGQPWHSFFKFPGSVPAGFLHLTAEELTEQIQFHADDDVDDVESPNNAATAYNFVQHVEQALQVARTTTGNEPQIDQATARLVAFSPGNIALRAVQAIVASSEISEEAVWRAAFILAEAFRRLFNRPETITLLTTLYKNRSSYWKTVLDYCADGNLRAVLDEYMYQLHSEGGFREIDEDHLFDMVNMAADALSLRSARYVGRTADADRSEISFSSGFAVRYGSGASSESGQASARMSEVRGAFNSPFAPFVLASTSVGQEGIDFHWWSHAVVHWNVPSNPVDFEQREGRVNRFGGHAVRKNVAQHHWEDVLSSNGSHAWRDAMAAAELTENDLGDFSPWWMYPGDARIDRVIAQYPLSNDRPKYERLRSALTSYRLTLGQPRQEDMMIVMEKNEIDSRNMPMIDLSAPRCSGSD